MYIHSQTDCYRGKWLCNDGMIQLQWMELEMQITNCQLRSSAMIFKWITGLDVILPARLPPSLFIHQCVTSHFNLEKLFQPSKDWGNLWAYIVGHINSGLWFISIIFHDQVQLEVYVVTWKCKGKLTFQQRLWSKTYKISLGEYLHCILLSEV